MYDGLTSWHLTFPIYHCRSWCFILISGKSITKMSIQTAFVYMVFTCLFSLSRTSGRSGTQTQRQEPGSDTPGGGPSDAPGSTFLRCAEGPAAAEGSAALSRWFSCRRLWFCDRLNHPFSWGRDARQGLPPRAPRCRFLDLSAFSLMQSPKQEPPRNRASANERLQNP